MYSTVRYSWYFATKQFSLVAMTVFCIMFFYSRNQALYLWKVVWEDLSYLMKTSYPPWRRAWRMHTMDWVSQTQYLLVKKVDILLSTVSTRHTLAITCVIFPKRGSNIVLSYLDWGQILGSFHPIYGRVFLGIKYWVMGLDLSTLNNFLLGWVLLMKLGKNIIMIFRTYFWWP